MRTAMLLALVACSNSDEIGPHDEIACDPGAWLINGIDPIETCERACKAPPPVILHSECMPDGLAGLCNQYVEVDGTGGCCGLDGRIATGLTVRWYECE